MPEAEDLLHAGPAQIDEPVPEARDIVDVEVVAYLKRRGK
jgi:hypothetical protein